MAAPQNGHARGAVPAEDESTAVVRLDLAERANVQIPATWLRVVAGAMLAGAVALAVAAWRMASTFSAMATKADVTSAVDRHATGVHDASRARLESLEQRQAADDAVLPIILATVTRIETLLLAGSKENP